MEAHHTLSDKDVGLLKELVDWYKKTKPNLEERDTEQDNQDLQSTDVYYARIPAGHGAPMSSSGDAHTAGKVECDIYKIDLGTLSLKKIGLTRPIYNIENVALLPDSFQPVVKHKSGRWTATVYPQVKFGVLSERLDACGTAVVGEQVIVGEENGVPEWGSANRSFKVTERFNQPIEAGSFIGAGYAGKGWFVPLAASCGDPCTVGDPPCPGEPPSCPGGLSPDCIDGDWVCPDEPPPECEGDPPTDCPSGNSPCCVDGTWTCCPDEPPPECEGDPPECAQGTSPCCVDGVWDCCNDEPMPCPSQVPTCPCGASPECVDGAWECPPEPECPPGGDQGVECLPGGSPCCICGLWECCYPDPCQNTTCPPGTHPEPSQDGTQCLCIPDNCGPGSPCTGAHPCPAPDCGQNATAQCIQGVWECVPTGLDIVCACEPYLGAIYCVCRDQLGNLYGDPGGPYVNNFDCSLQCGGGSGGGGGGGAGGGTPPPPSGGFAEATVGGDTMLGGDGGDTTINDGLLMGTGTEGSPDQLSSYSGESLDPWLDSSRQYDQVPLEPIPPATGDIVIIPPYDPPLDNTYIPVPISGGTCEEQCAAMRLIYMSRCLQGIAANEEPGVGGGGSPECCSGYAAAAYSDCLANCANGNGPLFDQYMLECFYTSVVPVGPGTTGVI